MSLNRKPPAPPVEQYAHSKDGSHPASGENNRTSSNLLSVTYLEILSTKLPRQYITPICGGIAGVASGIVTCPLDVIKTRLQAHGRANMRKRYGRSTPSYKGMVGTAGAIWRQDGFRGMYRGLGPMLLGYLPTWAVYLTVYDRSKNSYYEVTDSWLTARLYASITAGACSTLVTNPIWVIKTRLMSQSRPQTLSDGISSPWQYTSTIDAARKMYRTEGLRAFYSGLTPALLGLTHVAIQFPLYESLKKEFTGLGMGEHTKDDEKTHFIGVSCATFLSKVAASMATYPHEVLRTRLQTQQRMSSPAHSPDGISHRGGLESPQDRGRLPGASSSDGMMNQPRYRGIIRTCKMILKEEGWRSFYNGMGTNLIRAVPAAMTTMLTYEFMQSSIYRLRMEGERKLSLQ
ncbi:MAG: hypothetical protein M1834_004553 [Cirrosporium novae-zelandiae]|nr:MAG: hypothetical protein M1834_004553 [Cirrosporium novae-zelandiae]